MYLSNTEKCPESILLHSHNSTFKSGLNWCSWDILKVRGEGSGSKFWSLLVTGLFAFLVKFCSPRDCHISIMGFMVKSGIDYSGLWNNSELIRRATDCYVTKQTLYNVLVCTNLSMCLCLSSLIHLGNANFLIYDTFSVAWNISRQKTK